MTTIYRNDKGSYGSRSGALSRRDILKRGSALGIGAALIVSGSAVVSADRAWGIEAKTLKPETMASLIAVARDIYPHDRLQDKYYAIAIKEHDEKAAQDAAHKDTIEAGIADLDRRAGGSYRALGWEDERTAILRAVEDTPFFQAVRGGLVVALYNQKEIWPLFGYEGESYSKGGYIERGFDDIEWL